MGDFDRNPPAGGGKPNETKKMAVVVVLGIVLMGLVAMQLMKHGDGPAPAAGAPISSGVSLPRPVVADEISPDALARMNADLQSDPTQPLLRQQASGDHSLDQVPANPFSMNPNWQKSLMAAAPDPGIVTPPRPSVDPRPTNPVSLTPATALRAEDFKLGSIINGNTAIINNRVVKANDIVGKARVLAIHDDTVVLQAADSPTGPTLLLSMAARIGE